MPPFFSDNWRQFRYKSYPVRIFRDQGYAGGGGLLFTECVIGQDFFNGNAGQINPSRIGGKLKTENVFGAAHGLAIVPIKWIFGQ